MDGLAQEQLRVLLLDTRHHVLDVVTLYQGTVNQTSARVAEIFRDAVRVNAPAIVLAHNHPSGDPAPSDDDIRLTQDAAEGRRAARDRAARPHRRRARALREPKGTPAAMNGEEVEVMHIRAAGFGAAVDAYARDEGDLWFVSMLGNQQSVRALWARLVKGEMAYLSNDQYAGGVPCWLAREARREWRFHSAWLPGTGAYQGMLVPAAGLYASERQDFLLLARHEEEAPALHYRFLNRRLDLPLHPSWSGWLWKRGLAAGEVLPLDGLHVYAYRCTPDAMALRNAISRAVRGHGLPVPDPVGR